MTTGSGGAPWPSTSTFPEMNSGCVVDGCGALMGGMLVLTAGLFVDPPLVPRWAVMVADKQRTKLIASTIRKGEELILMTPSAGLLDHWIGNRVLYMATDFCPLISGHRWADAVPLPGISTCLVTSNGNSFFH